MIYVEYIERDRFLPIEIFEHLGRQAGWVSDIDVKIGNLGRAERLGPGPSVICLWRNAGMARMDEWEAGFRGAEAMRDAGHQALRHAVHFQAAGLYDELIGGPPLGDGLHFVEFFDAGEDIDDDAIRAHYRTRAGKHDHGKLDFLLRRIGLMGPDPANLAIWTFAGYAAAEPIMRERHGTSPLRPVKAGLYWNFETALI